MGGAILIEIVIPGQPQAKGRPRVTRRGFLYTPTKTLNYEILVKELFIVKYPNFEPLDGPVRMRLAAFMKMPQTSKRKTDLMLSGEIQPCTKPDLSNILKACEDALSSVAFLDDKQIVALIMEKKYSSRLRVELTIEEIS